MAADYRFYMLLVASLTRVARSSSEFCERNEPPRLVRLDVLVVLVIDCCLPS